MNQVDEGQRPPQGKGRGFSLIEATVALGICATGVLLLLSLLPLALDSLSQSSDRNAQARIRQAVSSRYAMIDWNILEEWARGQHVETLHFDGQGAQVVATDIERTHAVDIRVEDRRTYSGDVEDNRYIRQIELRITDTPERADALTNPDYYELVHVSLGHEGKLKTKYRD